MREKGPSPTLRSDTTPQLWILGAEDYEAPSAVTGRPIKSLIVGPAQQRVSRRADEAPGSLARR